MGEAILFKGKWAKPTHEEGQISNFLLGNHQCGPRITSVTLPGPQAEIALVRYQKKK